MRRVRPHGAGAAGVLAALAVASLAAPPPATAQPRPVTAPSAASATTTATAFVRALDRADWIAAAASADLPPPPGAPTTEAFLQAMWTQLLGRLGTLTTLGPGSAAAEGANQVVDVGARFARSEVTLRVVVGPAGKVVGFWITPPKPPAYTPPPYADLARVREVGLTVGAAPALPATLTLPRDPAGPFPVAVLVHGSGPNDRDERVAGNRPFKDLALGLAARGVAVLRYDKRTYAHPRALAGRRVTLDVETVDDALAALAAARAAPGADPARVFVIGHSLGATFAPEIAERDGRAAGAVLLAPAGRPLAEVTAAQLAFLAERARAAGRPTADFDAARRQMHELAARRLAPDVPVLGAPAWYWYDLDDRRPLERARASRVPLLSLFGGRDYQVTREDAAAWEQALARRAGAEVVTFPALNHLFVAGEGPSSPDEYQARPGHVDGALVDAVARWIGAQRPNEASY